MARRSVREHAARGAHGIKAYASLPVPLFRATADESRKVGLPVIAHGTNLKEVVHCVLAGISFTEHLDGPRRYYGDVHELLAQAEIYWTPTLSIMGGTRTIGAPDDFLASDRGKFFRHLHENEIGDLRGGKKHGARILIGTDNPMQGMVGERHHMELQAFSMAGFSSLELLDLATRQAAGALGIADQVGSIEIGKLGDLVLLDSDPLADIRNTRTIWRVIKAGWVFDPQGLRSR
jgi:imidazolonepropionase-like amidohydrolase